MKRQLTEQDREDIRRMRELFWMRVRREITHEKLIMELKKINGRQLRIETKEDLICR